MDPGSDQFKERAIRAAENALAAAGSVGPLELLVCMRLLSPPHLDEWRRGRIATLDSCIQGSPKKLARAFAYFADWAHEKGLKTVQASYTRAGVHGPEPLRVTEAGDKEEFFRTHYAPAELPERKSRQLEAKLKKAPDLVVFQTVAESVVCSECKTETFKGQFLFMEKGKPLCLTCADLDELLFLPSGDAAVSRRARKYSPLSAIVVRFSRARKRYERQGILVAEDAISRAEAECVADAPERAALRARAMERRQEQDVEFVTEMAKAIRQMFPACPAEEAEATARHAGLRGSGRVGRSAAGRALDERALQLAVVAHVRHEHTNYDELLMNGTERQDARVLVREAIDTVLARWRGVA